MAHSPIKGPQKNNRGEAVSLFLWYLKTIDMVSISTFTPMFDEMDTNMAGSSYSSQPFGLQGFMLMHIRSVFVFECDRCVFDKLLYSITLSLLCYMMSLSHPSSNGKEPACG